MPTLVYSPGHALSYPTANRGYYSTCHPERFSTFMTAIDDLNGLTDRIRASANRLTDLAETQATERKQRNELIVQAVDEAGMTQAAVARAAGLSTAAIIHILAASDEGD